MIKELKVKEKQRYEKLNKIEKLKEKKIAKEVYHKIEEYAKNGYDLIPQDEKNFFLKCFGIFDKPATPNEFMMRVRIPGGHLNNEQALTLGRIAKEYGRDYMDLTTRAQVELRYLSVENLPSVLKKLESVGMTSYQTGVDNLRGIVGDPLDYQAFDNILPSQNTLLNLEEKFLYKPEFLGLLPRKFNTSITGSISNRCNAFGHDCCFVLAQKDGIYGYNLYLGGRVGMLAKSADMFLKDEDEVLLAYEAVINLFKEYGFKDSRNKNRLIFLIQLAGMQTISNAIRKQAGVNFQNVGKTLTKLTNIDSTQGKILLKDGSFAYHIIVPAGVFGGSSLVYMASIANRYGNGDVRIDVEQNLYLMGIKKDKLEEIKKEDIFKRYKNTDSVYVNNLIACAGEEHCKFGVIKNKSDALELAKYLEKTVPLEKDCKIRMYWSACVKGCGLHDLGDIGFEGCKSKVNGVSEYGVHIFLGGNTTGESRMGESIMKSIPLRFAHKFIEELVSEYKKLKLKGENFEEFYERVLCKISKQAISFIMRLKAYLKKIDMDIKIGFDTIKKSGKIERYEIFELGEQIYFAIFKRLPYRATIDFEPILKNELILPQDLDKNLSKLLQAMLEEKKIKRAKVFSELEGFINVY